MANEGGGGLASADIPVLGVGVDGTGDEGVVVGEEGEAHDVSIVASELADLERGLETEKNRKDRNEKSRKKTEERSIQGEWGTEAEEDRTENGNITSGLGDSTKRKGN